MSKTACTFRLPARTLGQLEALGFWANRNKTDLLIEAINVFYAIELSKKNVLQPYCNTEKEMV